MISAKKLIRLARKWQKLAIHGRKRITTGAEPHSKIGQELCSSASRVEKGQFVVYSNDNRRFMLPLEYLNNEIVKELLNLAEEEFGLPSNGSLILPCDAAFLRYIISLLQRNVSSDVEKALVMSVASGHCSPDMLLHQAAMSQQSLVCSY